MLTTALEHLVMGFFDPPAEVKVVSASRAGGVVLVGPVNPVALGRVIGRSGRTAKALRTIVAALADGRRVRVDVVDTDD